MIDHNTTKNYKPLTERENWLANQIIEIALSVHKALGPGLLEGVYEKCFCYELTKRRIPYERQKNVKIVYDGLVMDDGLRIDILVNALVIVELKSQEYYHPVWDAQVLSYLKLSEKRLGYILNFNVPVMKEGISRKIV